MSNIHAKGFSHGTAYVAAVGLGLMVAAIALGGISIARSRATANALRRDEIRARTVARAAIEHARAAILADSDWRSNHANGSWATEMELADGVFSYSVENPAGALDRSSLDSVIVTGDASCGTARQRLSVQLDAQKVALNCLNVPLVAGGAVTATSAFINPSGATIASNAGFTSVLSSVSPNVEAGLTIIGTGFSGSTTAGAAARTLPSSTVFDSYIASGTAISISALPVVFLKPTLQKVVLSPSSNPYGAPNSSGIYVIDCQNQSLNITNCRIAGTLVLLNPGLNTTVSGSVRWAPAVTGYPCLLVRGSVSLQLSSSSLSENSLNVNFNPPGTPYTYPAGATDTDTSDSYPSSITGLVYASGNVSTSGSSSISMLMVGGTLSIGGTLTLSYDSTYANSPPPGFYTVNMTPSQGTWRFVTDALPQSDPSESLGGAMGISN